MTVSGVDPRVFDATAALDIAGGMDDLLAELVGMFLELYPADLAVIQQAAAVQDWRALGLAAHKLKGTAGGLAAKGLYEAAQRLEATAMSVDVDAAAAASVQAELERQLRQLTVALQCWLSQASAAG